MKVKRQFAESLVYVGLCFITLGIAFVLRVVITQAIRMAFKNEEETK